MVHNRNRHSTLLDVKIQNTNFHSNEKKRSSFFHYNFWQQNACNDLFCEQNVHSQRPYFFTDTPYCTTNNERHVIVVARNSSVTLVCDIASEPSNDISYLWVRKTSNFAYSRVLGKGGVINGDSPTLRVPGLIDLIPSSNESQPGSHFRSEGSFKLNSNSNKQFYNTNSESYIQAAQQARGPPVPDLPFVKQSDILDGRKDPNNRKRSFLTLVATEELSVLCYAKNSEGRSKVPCTYSIAVVGEYIIFLYLLSFNMWLILPLTTYELL